jgi:hypothetical protein
MKVFAGLTPRNRSCNVDLGILNRAKAFRCEGIVPDTRALIASWMRASASKELIAIILGSLACQ